MARELAIKYAWQLIGLPYRWGGDDPINGFDCSGFVIEILRSVGILPRSGDWTAEGLRKLFECLKIDSPRPGALAFWIWDGRAVHVELCIDEKHTIGASGGGSRTTSQGAAAEQNAFIKLRPIRSGAVFIDPFVN